MVNYNRMKKTQLIRLCEMYGLSSEGLKPVLVARIQAHEALDAINKAPDTLNDPKSLLEHARNLLILPFIVYFAAYALVQHDILAPPAFHLDDWAAYCLIAAAFIICAMLEVKGRLVFLTRQLLQVIALLLVAHFLFTEGCKLLYRYGYLDVYGFSKLMVQRTTIFEMMAVVVFLAHLVKYTCTGMSWTNLYRFLYYSLIYQLCTCCILAHAAFGQRVDHKPTDDLAPIAWLTSEECRDAKDAGPELQTYAKEDCGPGSTDQGSCGVYEDVECQRATCTSGHDQPDSGEDASCGTGEDVDARRTTRTSADHQLLQELEQLKPELTRSVQQTEELQQLRRELERFRGQKEELESANEMLRADAILLTRRVDTMSTYMKMGLHREKAKLKDFKHAHFLQSVAQEAGAFTVFVRVRPDQRTCADIRCGSEGEISLNQSRQQSEGVDVTSNTYKFTGVFPQDTKTCEVSDALEAQITGVARGHNVVVIADGQSGSGKTTTMFDPRGGIVPSAARQLLSFTRQAVTFVPGLSYDIEYSLLEFYDNNSLRDLLCNASETSHVSCSADKAGLYRSSGARSPKLLSPLSFDKDVTQAIGNRKTAPSTDNAASSRGDFLCTFTVARNFYDERRVTRLHIVDLAGNERPPHFTETPKSGLAADSGRINTRRLTFQQQFARWNDSGETFSGHKLIRLLRGQPLSKVRVCFIYTISSAQADLAKTRQTLDRALEARTVWHLTDAEKAKRANDLRSRSLGRIGASQTARVERKSPDVKGAHAPQSSPVPLRRDGHKRSQAVDQVPTTQPSCSLLSETRGDDAGNTTSPPDS